MEVDLNEMANENVENNAETNKNPKNNPESNKSPQKNDQANINNLRTDYSDGQDQDFTPNRERDLNAEMKEMAKKYDSKLQLRKNIVDTYKDLNRKDRIKSN